MSLQLLEKLPAPIRRTYRQGLYWTTIALQTSLPRASGSYVILGHGKSGTNWLCHLVADYFGMPIFKSWQRMTPTMAPHVFHMHRYLLTGTARSRTFYIHRDGRDVVISSYFANMKAPWDTRTKDHFESYLGEEMHAERVTRHLPRYIDWYFGIDKSSSIRWAPHVTRALNSNYTMLSFERLKHNALEELSGAFERMNGTAVDRQRLQEVIAQHDFAKKKSKDNAHFLRSGESGDWRKYFSRTAAKKFDTYAGSALIELGYEKDHSWVDECSANE